MNCTLSYPNYYCFLCEKIAYHPYKTPCYKTICDKCLGLKDEIYHCKYCNIQHKKEEAKLNHFKREKIKIVQSSKKKSPVKGANNLLWPNTLLNYTSIDNIDVTNSSKRNKRVYNEMISNTIQQSALLSSAVKQEKPRNDNDDDLLDHQFDLLIMKFEGNDSLSKYQENQLKEITIGNESINAIHKKRFKY